MKVGFVMLNCIKPEILIVEDNELDRKYCQVFWQRAGYNPDFAKSVDEAIKKLKEKIYNYVISDVQMPEHDGLYMAKHMKDNYPEIPFFFTSAVPDVKASKELFEELYCDKLIPKPLYPEKFEEAIGLKARVYA